MLQDELDYNSADDYDDDLYKGPEDRARLAAMNEMEREMILAERGEKRDNRYAARAHLFGSRPLIGAYTPWCSPLIASHWRMTHLLTVQARLSTLPNARMSPVTQVSR